VEARPHGNTVKLALGFFHFNIQYVAGDLAIYHRYCTQAIIPFLDAISLRREYRVTMGLSGSGLEFLDKHYPGAVELLRRLVELKQIELVSTTYAPTLWVAFPRRDLVRSIELNDRCLRRLRFQPDSTFFSQEAFFGPGIATIAPLRQAAICKDDYVLEVAKMTEAVEPVYSHRGMRILVGSNHLLNEHARSLKAGSLPALTGFLRERIQKAPAELSSERGVRSGQKNGVEWLWYHMGSGHHFTIPTGPEDGEWFFYHPEWTELNLRYFDDLLEKGYTLATISDYSDALATATPPALPFVTEGSWNARQSGQVYAWMGRQAVPWQDSASILGSVWRSRAELVSCEQTTLGADPVLAGRLRDQIDELWRWQILAESSDSFGWRPQMGEVQFVRKHVETVLQGCAQIRLQARVPIARRLDEPAQMVEESSADVQVVARLQGAEGGISYSRLAGGIQVCEASFKATAFTCGIHFACNLEFLAYSPSGLEDEVTTVSPDYAREGMCRLPLANGLIRVSDDIYVVRVNRYGQMAARLQAVPPEVCFEIDQINPGRSFRWQFLIYRGEEKEALKLANTENAV
jgi:hypothetical protein